MSNFELKHPKMAATMVEPHWVAEENSVMIYCYPESSTEIFADSYQHYLRGISFVELCEASVMVTLYCVKDGNIVPITKVTLSYESEDKLRLVVTTMDEKVLSGIFNHSQYDALDESRWQDIPLTLLS